jgi:hypothetical protein
MIFRESLEGYFINKGVQGIVEPLMGQVELSLEPS